MAVTNALSVSSQTRACAALLDGSLFAAPGTELTGFRKPKNFSIFLTQKHFIASPLNPVFATYFLAVPAL